MPSHSGVVVAIDIGSTYSGYAFSTSGDFRNDPANVFINQVWFEKFSEGKCPTCILFDQKMKYIAFGFEAQEKYKQILKDKIQNEYYFCEKFKMSLYGRQQIDDTGFLVEDVVGKPVQAETVFVGFIKALSDHFRAIGSSKIRGFKESEISWILTVPTLWTEAAKKFMRDCGVKAGLGENITFALEPETAAVYCWTTGLLRERISQQFLLVDIGGGTTDTVVQELQEDGKMKNVCAPLGERCGGTDVDKAFLKVFSDVLGNDAMSSLKTEHIQQYTELLAGIEGLKKKDSKRRLQVPIATFDTVCHQHQQKGFASILNSSRHKDSLKIVGGDKLEFKVEFYLSIFKNTIQTITSLIEKTLEVCGENSVGSIYMVGGLSESVIVQKAIKDKFPQKVQTVKEAALAVLKGAVTYGHQPDIICSRVLPYTYGIASSARFVPGMHDEKKAVLIKGVKRCQNIFHSLITAKTRVQYGQKCSHTFKTLDEYQDIANLRVYKSPAKNPKYVDEEGCQLLTTIRIEIENPSKNPVKILVEFEFGSTELKVTAKREGTTQEFRHSLEYSIRKK